MGEAAVILDGLKGKTIISAVSRVEDKLTVVLEILFADHSTLVYRAQFVPKEEARLFHQHGWVEKEWK